jgi:universal stress protein A
MRMFEKILCPVDFSESSVKALQWSEYLTRKFHSELVVLHVMDFFPAPADVGIDYEKYQSMITTTLREFVEPLTVRYEKMLSTGDPATKISALADGLGATVIIMGTRGITGTIHRLIGSVAERVVRTAPVPVFSISPNCPAPSREESQNHMLVPMSSLHRLPHGFIRLRKVLRELRADPTFIYVVDFHDPMFDSTFDANPFLVTTYQTVEKKEELARLGNLLSKNGFHCSSEIRFGDISVEILKELETANYDYVLLGARKKNFLTRFIETNTYKIISQSSVPAITVKVE